MRATERRSDDAEYDLSTLKNSKGGFLLGDEDDDERAAKQRKIAEDLKKERQREAERRGADEQHDALLGLRPPEQDPRCENCRSIELDMQISRHFKVFVCPKCHNELPEKYSLLTKTECKLDYLLTDRASVRAAALTSQPSSRTPISCRTCSRRIRIDRPTRT